MLPIPGETTATEVPKLMEGAKLAFVLALRTAFSSSLAHKNLKYDADPTKTKIKIYTAHPQKLEFLPAMVVSVGGGDASIKYMMDDFVDEVEDQGLVNYAGQLSFTVSITAMSESTQEREKIIDHLIFFIRHIFIDIFRRTRTPKFNFDLVYTKDIRVGPENIIEVANKPAYEQTMDVPVYMEYHATVDQSGLETLRAISVEEIQGISSVDIEQQ
jgi:hypothetical protein